MPPFEYTSNGGSDENKDLATNASPSFYLSQQVEAAEGPANVDVVYVVTEVLVAVMAVFGNLLVIIAFALDKRLRRLTNYYIVSLAAADFLVGLLGVPFAVLTSLGLPHHFRLCLFMLSVLIVLCTISIFNLVAVSVDRFWAILFPLEYARLMTRRAAQGIIFMCWILGGLVGFMPVMGWHSKPNAIGQCLFTDFMDYDFLVFLYFATIIFPSVLMGAFYARIYCVVLKQVRQITALERGQSVEGDLLRTASRRDVNAAKNLFIIVLFFVLCWIPLYTINCIMAFCTKCHVPDPLMSFTIVLSHANSAGNPVLYACHLRDFRDAMRRCISRKRPCSAAASAGSLPTIATLGRGQSLNSTPNMTTPLQLGHPKR